MEHGGYVSGGRFRTHRERKLKGLLHRTHTPASPLADFIEDFWLYDEYEPRHLKERILPSGTVELVINLRDNELRIYDRARPGVCERRSGAIVSGAYDRFFVIDTAEEASLLGVHFKPAGAFPFLGLPASELVDAHVDLETLWGRPGRQLRERLLAATRPIDKFRLLEATLAARLSGCFGHHGAVRRALDAFSRCHAATVRDITELVGLSHRRFIEVFNIRHFRSGEGVRVVRPRTLIEEARAWMGSFGT